MIGRLQGTFGGLRRDGTVIIDTGGVGYCVRMPALAAISLGLEGAPVSLFIHTAVREDAIDLYGFLNEEGLAFFRQLMSVSSVGPKTALGILNVADVATLKRAIAGGDAAVLTRVYGLGKKSAERIVVELRDKIAREGFGGAASDGSDSEVLEALESLGYRLEESRGALKEVDASVSGVRERLSAALKILGTAKTR